MVQHAADVGDTDALVILAARRQDAGDRRGAETLYQRFADAGNADALTRLAEMRWEAGDCKGADALARRAADAGDASALIKFARARSRDSAPGAASVLRESCGVRTYFAGDLARSGLTLRLMGWLRIHCCPKGSRSRPLRCP